MEEEQARRTQRLADQIRTGGPSDEQTQQSHERQRAINEMQQQDADRAREARLALNRPKDKQRTTPTDATEEEEEEEEARKRLERRATADQNFLRREQAERDKLRRQAEQDRLPQQAGIWQIKTRDVFELSRRPLLTQNLVKNRVANLIDNSRVFERMAPSSTEIFNVLPRVAIVQMFSQLQPPSNAPNRGFKYYFSRKVARIQEGKIKTNRYLTLVCMPNTRDTANLPMYDVSLRVFPFNDIDNPDYLYSADFAELPDKTFASMVEVDTHWAENGATFFRENGLTGLVDVDNVSPLWQINIIPVRTRDRQLVLPGPVFYGRNGEISTEMSE